ncbi:helix-turn-helix domain-containing protein [Alkalihalobacillus sp. AL-G]|uniref:helix-turn-helix domain-containing protein n=1 Tax=Alkalihalobacillus sp. AL-G TaxID=2926399 RepID=UPI00272D108D|nr:helix-turn-helix transcriptional regulator [Alkalihalobacillus sp. AL-G]WLD91778.1 helix-turn-helix domain-containing protein [Alkalihalobacillus sp. AL-G]
MKLEQAVGLVLRKHRTVEKISQFKLAKLTGYDRSFISLLERGQRVPSVKTIFVLTEHLQISPSQFIDEVHELVDSDIMEYD